MQKSVRYHISESDERTVVQSLPVVVRSAQAEPEPVPAQVQQAKPLANGANQNSKVSKLARTSGRRASDVE